MRILVLGGTGEGLAIARQLGVDDIYSIAGLGVTPVALRCAVRVGGFGGAHGLACFARAHGISLIVDATHPYAARISANALAAAREAGIACWALHRAPWRRGANDDWREVADWAGIVAAIAPFRRPLFTLGRAPLAHLGAIPAHQHWVVRCLDAAVPRAARATLVAARGPFTVDGERAFFDAQRIDVVVSKLSGGTATQAKLDVARERGLPVIMLARPATPATPTGMPVAPVLAPAGSPTGSPTGSPVPAPSPDRIFTCVADVLRALADLSSRPT